MARKDFLAELIAPYQKDSYWHIFASVRIFFVLSLLVSSPVMAWGVYNQASESLQVAQSNEPIERTGGIKDSDSSSQSGSADNSAGGAEATRDATPAANTGTANTADTSGAETRRLRERQERSRDQGPNSGGNEKNGDENLVDSVKSLVPEIPVNVQTEI